MRVIGCLSAPFTISLLGLNTTCGLISHLKIGVPEQGCAVKASLSPAFHFSSNPPAIPKGKQGPYANLRSTSQKNSTREHSYPPYCFDNSIVPDGRTASRPAATWQRPTDGGDKPDNIESANAESADIEFTEPEAGHWPARQGQGCQRACHGPGQAWTTRQHARQR